MNMSKRSTNEARLVIKLPIHGAPIPFPGSSTRDLCGRLLTRPTRLLPGGRPGSRARRSSMRRAELRRATLHLIFSFVSAPHCSAQGASNFAVAARSWFASQCKLRGAEMARGFHFHTRSCLCSIMHATRSTLDR